MLRRLRALRKGSTLAELLVGMVLSAIALAAATGSVLRQQRTASRTVAIAGADAQIRAATAILAAELSHLDGTRGDLAVGEASDSALQFRAVVATSLACSNGSGAATFTPEVPGVAGVSAGASLPRAGDSLWWRADTAWQGARVSSVSTGQAVCTAPVPAAIAATTYRLALDRADSIAAGTPLRVTRLVRFAFYRSGDGSWQLGYREWSEATGRFTLPQPIAGPFVLRPGEPRTSFRYFDAAGAELPVVAGSVDVVRVARVRLTVLSRASSHLRGQDSVRIDSADAALQRSRER